MWIWSLESRSWACLFLIDAFIVYVCVLKQLEPTGSQYREGEEYCILQHIQNGSYGDVFCVRDNRTGFECAAKRVSQERVSHVLKSRYAPPKVCVNHALLLSAEPMIVLEVIDLLLSVLLSTDLRFHWVTSAARRWARGALWTALGSWSSSGPWGRSSTLCSSWTWSQVNSLHHQQYTTIITISKNNTNTLHYKLKYFYFTWVFSFHASFFFYIYLTAL